MATLQPSYSSCTAAGQTGVMSCAEEQFDAVSQTSQVVTGNIRGINCTFTFWGCVLTFAGNLTGNTYNNITAVLTRSVSAGLNASWPNTAACRSIMGTTGGGTAPMTWGTSTSPPAPLSYTVTSVFKPSIQHN
ncbi:MAG TPA: hypothetical protein VK501_05365 [Baekduia sp.]|uniref:hypothetical protein n=1 Tax=Baekduia sp. TaxID=2600305 RepID=UPI002CB5E97F|nr:hypothetical protein [Baekduia sp.]HMJ33327.1 hypothetical protein [Baekduia sp.]